MQINADKLFIAQKFIEIALKYTKRRPKRVKNLTSQWNQK